MNPQPKTEASALRVEVPYTNIDSRIAVILSAAQEVLKSNLAKEHVSKIGSTASGYIRQRETLCDAESASGFKYTVHEYKLNAREGDTGYGLITIAALNPSEHPDKMEHATGLEYVLCREAGQYNVFVRNKGLVNGKPDETLRQITDDVELEMIASKINGLKPIADVHDTTRA